MPGHKSRLSLAEDPLARRRVRQRDCQFGANLTFRVNPCLKSNQLEAGEISQWVKCSPHKH